MRTKPSFLLTFFKNHFGHRLQRFEQVLPQHLTYVLNKRVLIAIKCFSCNVIMEYDFVPTEKFYINV